MREAEALAREAVELLSNKPAPMIRKDSKGDFAMTSRSRVRAPAGSAVVRFPEPESARLNVCSRGRKGRDVTE